MDSDLLAVASIWMGILTVCEAVYGSGRVKLALYAFGLGFIFNKYLHMMF